MALTKNHDFLETKSSTINQITKEFFGIFEASSTPYVEGDDI